MTDAAEAEREQEPQHPGWQSLAQVLHTTNPLFEKILFLPGYEFSSNIYVIVGDYLTIVDPGNDYTAYMELWKHGFQPADIKKIVLTHGHRDHAMGAFELLRSYADVFRRSGFELTFHPASPREMKEFLKELGCGFTEVKGGETLELGGFEWEVIHTPGHTVDGLCFYHAPTKTAFTGDTVLPHAMADADKHAGGRLDYYLFSVKSLLKRDIENVLPGHGLPVAAFGHRVIEETYESLMLKILGVEDQISWMGGARALVERGLLEEAVYCCEKAILRDSGTVEARQLKALCLNDLGRFEEALEVLEPLRQTGSAQADQPYTFIARGYAQMGLARYDESLKCFDEALRLKPDSRDALMYKGMALYLAGRYEEAMEIENFRAEFVERFKEELDKKNKTV